MNSSANGPPSVDGWFWVGIHKALYGNRRRTGFSDRLRASRCPVCGPGMGIMARDVQVLGDDDRHAVVAVLCRHCGGHSAAFREEAYS